MLKRFGFALGAILAVGMLASCVINTSSDDDEKSPVDYTDYLSGSYSIKVKNECSSKVVCFMGEPSDETLISGAIGGGKTTGLKKDTKLFKDSSFDFVLYVYTEDAYLNGKKDYKTLAQNPLCRLYAFYNAKAEKSDNLIYTISDKLGGEYYFSFNNNTPYNCEIRTGGLYGEPFCYSGSYTLHTKVYAQEGDYYFYPVFRKFDSNAGTILTSYPKTTKGNPKMIQVGLGKGEEAARIDCTTFLPAGGFPMAASATYLKVTNGISTSVGISLYKGATSLPTKTDTGIATINPGKSATFSIGLDRVSGDASTTDVKYAEDVVVAGWKVGPEVNPQDLETQTLLGGELYEVVVSGPDYDDVTCAYRKETDGSLKHTTMNIN